MLIYAVTSGLSVEKTRKRNMIACLCISIDESRPDMDEVTMLTAITLFLLSASNELVGVTVLQKGCMDRFRNGLNSYDPGVSTCVYK